jgi:hypothetical protein
MPRRLWFYANRVPFGVALIFRSSGDPGGAARRALPAPGKILPHRIFRAAAETKTAARRAAVAAHATMIAAAIRW